MGGLAVLALLGLYIFLAITVFNAAKTTSAKVIAVLLILLIPTADAIYGRINLQKMCKTEAGLKVYKVAHNVEGFADVNTASDYWVKEHGYQFVEKLSTNGLTIRWSRLNDQTVIEEKVFPKSMYKLDHKYIGWLNNRYLRSQYFIESNNGEILATNTQIGFNGGWAERLIALFSDAGVSSVAWCSNTELELDERKMVLSVLKHSGE